MDLLDWFKPKRDPPKRSKVVPSTTSTSTGTSKFPKTTTKWKTEDYYVCRLLRARVGYLQRSI